MKQRPRMGKPFLSLVLVCTLILTCLIPSASAASEDLPISLRVNGALVDCPDGSPYLDSASRTMVPLRFLSEALGAEVAWNGSEKQAEIRLGDLTLLVPIGSSRLTLQSPEGTSEIPMDTVSVLKEGRTYLPVRFLAEALGCHVSYSKAYRTVEIYQDVLTPQEINTLHDLTLHWKPTKSRAFLMGDRWTYENLSEYALRMYQSDTPYLASFTDRGGITHTYDNPGHGMDAKTEFLLLCLKEKVETTYGNRLIYGDSISATFRTDASCLYASPAAEDFLYLCDGILTVRIDDPAMLAKYQARHSGVSWIQNMKPGVETTILYESVFTLRLDETATLLELGSWDRTNDGYFRIA